MRIHLMFRDHSFVLKDAAPWNSEQLLEDLDLKPILEAMAGKDEFIGKVVSGALLSGVGDTDTVLYRQEALKDALANPQPVRQAYEALTASIEEGRKKVFWITNKTPGSVLFDSVLVLEVYLQGIDRVREIFLKNGSSFVSQAFRGLLASFTNHFNREYTEEVRSHLSELEFPHGLDVRVTLGAEAELAQYTPLRPKRRRLRQVLPLVGGPRYTWSLPERDDAGAEELENMRNLALDRLARAAGRAAQHVLEFVNSLRTELAFYVGCLNLYERLQKMGVPLCFPKPVEPGSAHLSFKNLVEAALALRMGGVPVPNTLDAQSRPILVVSGANRGGKTVFLRSIGQAQLMMMAGMFVAAEHYESAVTRGLHTHFRREEDASLKRGKLDEELSRLSQIVDHVRPGDLVLLNETFSSTDEREGSEMARNVVTALADHGVRVIFVTHLYEIQRWLAANRQTQTLFLRAERKEDGTRTYRIIVGQPLDTSFAEDVYRKVFGDQGSVDEGRPGGP